MAYVYPNCVSVVLWEGGRIRLNPDQKWPADDPFVTARPEFFSAEPRMVASSPGYAPVERATAAPGETRRARRPKQSKPAAQADSSESNE
ncbi:hypothetical protein C8D88_116132 [Lentzea atacamensis]|uniref:Uncharacterized protein n=1 Tax=Lentzea atacamensis TaxID=531938 RepID=A0A316HNG7_9PSEU|nr:hypothetical protein [Lentzea atacamensis]PWK81720.1 hypothetical protein C8D88_116132 [Lentzea atacamensis]